MRACRAVCAVAGTLSLLHVWPVFTPLPGVTGHQDMMGCCTKDNHSKEPLAFFRGGGAGQNRLTKLMTAYMST